MRSLKNILKIFASHIQGIVLILFLSFLYGFVNFIWLRRNLYPYGPDEFAHLTISIRYYLLLLNSPTELIASIIDYSRNWPPFFHILASLVYLIFGYSYFLAVETNVLYSAILFSCVYYIGYKLYSRKVAILAILCTAFYPAIFVYSRIFNPDFAMTAFVCLAAALLLTTNNFKERRASIILGFVLGLGMLVKWTFAVYICGPLLAVFLCQRKRQLANFSFSYFIGAGIASLWYIPNCIMFFKRIKMYCWDTVHCRTAIGPKFIPDSLFGLDKFFKYFMLLFNEGMALFFILIFIYALVFYLFKNKTRIFLLSWAILPYCVLSLSYQKEIRFLLPVLPALALITAAGLDKISSFKQRIFWWAAIVIIGSAQFYDISFNDSFQIRPASLFYSSTRVQDNEKFGPPWKEDWHFERLAQAIESSDPYRYVPNFSHPDPAYNIGIICEDDAASKIVSYPFVLDYYLAKDKNSTQNIRVYSLMAHRDFLDFLFLWRKFDTFVVISKSDPWPQPQNLIKKLSVFAYKKFNYFDFSLQDPLIFEESLAFREHAFRKLQDFLKVKPESLELADRVELAGGYSAFVYANKRTDDGRNIFISQDDMTVSFYQGLAHIFYNGKPLTARGIETSFKLAGKEYLSTGAHWSLDKKSDSELSFIGHWDGLSDVTQRLDFKFSKDGDIDSDVTMESANKEALAGIEGLRVLASLDPGYRSWETTQEQGRFSNANKGGVILKDATTQFLSLSGPEQQDICFMLKQPDYSLAQIHYTKKERMLKYWVRQPQMSGKIKLPDIAHREILKAEQKNKDIQRSSFARGLYSLRQDGLELFFDFGQGRIFLNGKEKTQGFGLYTSIFANGLWQDSQNALWSIEKPDNKTLVARGQWLGLPLEQAWTIVLKDKDTIIWNIDLKVTEKMDLGVFQSNVMLAKASGAKIEFSVLNKDGSFGSSVFEADFLPGKSSVLSHGSTKKRLLSPGFYKDYFKGEIRIE